MSAQRPKCVAMVTPAWPLGAQPNGIVSYTSRITAAFREFGVLPVVLSWEVQPGHSGPAVVDIRDFGPPVSVVSRGIERVRRSISGAFVSPHYRRSLLNAFEHATSIHSIEILQMEEAFGHSVGLLRRRRVPVVVRLHGPWFLNGEINGLPKDAEFLSRVAAERESIASADAITAPSLDVLNQTRAYYDLPLESAAVIPNPFELDDAGEPWSLATCDRNRVVFIGRFDLHKGADVLLDAFTRVAAKRPELVLDFVGPDRGIPGDGRSVVSLSDYLAANVPSEIRARIHVHGAQSLSAIDDIRRRGYLTVIPSRYETFGNTALEALAAGCPVVASNAGGLGEIVRGDETGLLVPPGDVAALAAAFERLLSNPELAVRLGARGRGDVAVRYRPHVIAEQTLDFYADVLSRWRERPRNSFSGLL